MRRCTGIITASRADRWKSNWGFRTVKKALGDQVMSIFLLPSSRVEWEQRLRNRGTDSEETILRRLKNGLTEMEAADDYDYRVVNDHLERAVNEVHQLLPKN